MTIKHARRRNATARLDEGPQNSSQQLSMNARLGAVWSMAATCLLRFSNILTTAVVAHIFNHRDFGIFTIAFTAYMVITVLGPFGLASCLTRADLDIDQLAPTMTTFSIATNAIQ